jgi:hypothetical protein
MPIAAVNEQNDARGSAWLLARMARDSIERSNDGLVNEPAMNSLYRLLEAYKAHRFFGFDHQPDARDEAEGLSFAPPAERGFAELKAAFAKAQEKAFGAGSSVHESVSEVEDVLVAVTYPKRQKASSKARARAILFLNSFIDSLEPARI